MALLAAGCGGGGGGGNNNANVNGRSYLYTSGGNTFALSIDAGGRFTIFETDAVNAPTGTGAQGTVGNNRQFSTQTNDGVLQFSGTISNDATSATGTVQHNGQTVFAFTAALVTPTSPTPGGMTGTYTGTSGANSALLTVDATSHGTLWANAGLTTGGGIVTISSNGALQTSNGNTTGVLGLNGNTPTLQITKLNGTAVNVQINLTQVSRAKWTFMVFLNGANDLQTYGPLNVNQMEQVGSTSGVNMVVQWKQANCGSCGNPAWASTRRYFINKDNDTSTVNSTLIQDMGPGIDMGDWHELRNFVLWSQQNYPADHYALVIWNHGAGWRDVRSAKSKVDLAARAVSIDDSTNHEIETWQLPQALDMNPQLDMVIFDASLMQMQEVAYEIRNQTPIIVGSEESPPGEGYPYHTFLADLVANPNMTSQQLGTQIVNRTYTYYQTTFFPPGNQQRHDITQSMLDTSKLQGVSDKLDAFAQSLINHRVDSATAETNARNNAQFYAYTDNKDLWHYADLIKNGTTATDLKNAAQGVQDAVDAAVLVEKHDNALPDSHGIAIYVPAAINYRSTYGNLALARATRWPQWLQAQP